MRLTSLTLHGFKSFGDRTTVEFSPGVTAIVGPNGSGKSNLIEALRWATGGGRASEYRAGEKTDLIFHGAKGKRSVSYAEVALELQHDRHTYRIARNLFRDGSTKLKLDGRTARFLDVDEALTGSGLGRGSLAVIGQGEVGQVLMASPEKLLEYVAEAAGVAKLRGRREQALSRLEDARLNLERLEDVRVGLEQYVEQLHTEAAQAARHSELSAESLRLRYTLALARRNSLSAEVSKLQLEQGELAEALAQGRTALGEAQQHWHTARATATRLETAYRDLLAATEARRGDVRVAQERVAGLDERLSALERERATVQQEKLRLEAGEAPTPPDAPLDSLQLNLDEASAAHQAAKASLSDAEDGVQQKRAEVEALKRQAVEQSRALAAYETSREQLAAQREALQSRLDTLEPETSFVKNEGQLQTLSEQHRALEGRYETLSGEVVKLQGVHAEAHAEVQALGRALERSRQTFAARRGYAQGPKHALTSGIEGIYGSVADLMRVPEAYRAALSSALGRRAEYVVVDTADTAQQVLAHVKKLGGWVTLLPLDLVKGRSSGSSLAGEPGVVGLATDLIETEAQFEPVFRQLIGSTLITENLEGAVALSRKHRSRPRLISLGGDIVESYGALSGGQSRGASPVIGAASDVEEAEAAAEAALEAEGNALSALQEMQAEALEMRSQLERSAQALGEARSAFTQRQEARAVAASLRAEVQDQLSVVLERLEALSLPEKVFNEKELEGAETELILANEALVVAHQHEASAAETYRDVSQTFARAEERWQQFNQAQRRYAAEQEHLKTLVDKGEDLVQLRQTVVRQREDAAAALEQAKAAVPTDLEEKETAWRDAQAESEGAEAALGPLSERQAERAERLETVKITLARRESALELALEEEAKFPPGVETLDISARSCRERLAAAEQELESLGLVNHRAAQDLANEQTRLEELKAQMLEAEAAIGELDAALERIDTETTSRLTLAASTLRTHFKEYAVALFGDGAVADVILLSEEGRPTGLKITLQPPGKQTQALNLLSVGERTMGALAFLFALTQGEGQRGLPLAVLDEVDAPLDEANIRRYCAFLEKLSTQGTQFVLITHQKATFEVADVLWGVTSEQGVSRLFSISKSETEFV